MLFSLWSGLIAILWLVLCFLSSGLWVHDHHVIYHRLVSVIYDYIPNGMLCFFGGMSFTSIAPPTLLYTMYLFVAP